MTDAATLDRPARTRRPPPRTLRIGLVPLLDAAPVVVADALGLFEATGLRAALSIEPSWAAVRDKLAFGALDAAQLLGPMPIALACGIGGVRADVTVAAGLGVNGNALTLSGALSAALGDPPAPLPASAFSQLVRSRAAAGERPLTLGVVFPFSAHNYLLRHWLAAGGLDPDRDLTLVSVPPPTMPDRLAAGDLDGFCAGEPWGSVAVAAGAGRIAWLTRDLWPGHPEKAFAFAEGYAEAAPEAAIAATAGIVAAARWLDDPAHRDARATLLRERLFPRLDTAAVAAALDRSGLLFRPATRPRRDAAAVWLRQMRRWGHVPADVADDAALAPFDTALWTRAAERLREPVPPSTPIPPELLA